MIIRELLISDLPEVYALHEKFFKDNERPQFFESGLGHCFVVADDNNKIIVAGGVKTIAETVVITDRAFPISIRLDALLQALGSSIYITQAMGYDQIHAFVNHDESYVRVLQKYGFKLLDAKLLILDLGDSNG